MSVLRWILRFAHPTSGVTLLRDLLERYQGGKTDAWFGNRSFVAMAVSAISEVGGYRRVGFAIGFVTGGLSISFNVARNDKGVGHLNLFCLAVPLLLMFCVALCWHRQCVNRAEVIRRVHAAAHIAGLIFSTLMLGFSVWWLNPSEGRWYGTLHLYPKFAVIDFIAMSLLVITSGYAARKWSERQSGIGLRRDGAR